MRSASKIKEHGTAMAYSHTIRSTKPPSEWRAHESLDPKRKNNNGPFEGMITREAADSEEHPNSTPIAVIFDVTGSMGSIPTVLQKKLPSLHGLLMRKGYVEDPQILFGAVGDAHTDHVPLQIGQFESDNTSDENLENILLEGHGGGGNHESYELAAYFMANHTHLDSFEKRGKKGYLFLIGDERIYDRVNRSQVARLIDDDHKLEADPTTEEVFAKLKEKYHVFFLFAVQGTYNESDVLPKEAANSGGWGGGAMGWQPLLGENAIPLDDANAVCETIGLALGMMEGTVSLEDGLEDLREVSGDEEAIRSAEKALATVGAGAISTTEASGDLPEDDEGVAGSERL